ncbi:MAG: UDP-N-acetylmuramate dehydrogenase [Candidatus Marinimicrobia bacterium]|nr:UDP-N-acetylmuramate dehydrogenase [Candidatus Neomarinimicrobiota bacterium]MBL7023286.1 UDP-N-acetylmuramate dehydrogenase [Candidatus Neomarinimicrobiota bacterium]MBL7108880.1 UDP-N-acetylmuramate dehydrogenase [Candidatus Neomarinimicrobiota bacterium]
MNSKIIHQINKVVMGEILFDEPMKNHTTFGIGGPASCFVHPQDTNDLINLLKLAYEQNLPVFFIGSGSNILVSDDGFDGIVISLKKNFSNLEITKTGEISAESGVLLGHLVNQAINAGLKGMENLAGIPGTVGGAIKMNASAYGYEISREFISAEVISMSGERKSYSSKDISFSYRHSTFNENEIIISTKFKCKFGSQTRIKYQKQKVSEKRRASQPLGVRSAGSIFKNPPHSPAGYLIDKANFKGIKHGGAEISTKHANFIINNNNASSEDVIHLISKIQNVVSDNDNIKLELEIKLLGFSNDIMEKLKYV